VVATVNVLLWLLLRQWRPWPGLTAAVRTPWPAVVAAIVLALPWLALGRYPLPPPAGTMRIAAVQGNIPQIRVPQPGQLEAAREVYLSLTRQIVADERPELVIWPETALPVPLLLDETTSQELRALLLATRTPMVVGSLDYRAPPAPAAPGDYLSFNSAMHLVPTPEVRVVDVYDKMHPVPFGEYVPFERTIPALSGIFGMGRGLTAGRRFCVFGVRPDVRLGPLICFEDVFPEIARGMVLRGANVLLTITNDAWYWETSGSRQHTLNSVLRAVETCRPLLRSGNNSDTCLVLPDGRIVDPLVDPATGSPFTRRAGLFQVPVYDALPITFYTRHGNLFAVLCSLVGALAAGWCLLRHLGRRQRLSRAIQPDR